jgi:hypothetical protein
MKVTELLEAKGWEASTIAGHLAVLDPAGEWDPESLYAFSATNREAAKQCAADLRSQTRGSDTFVSKPERVEGVFVVYTFDHRSKSEDAALIGFGSPLADLKARLKQASEDGDLNIDPEMFDDGMTFVKVRVDGYV